MGVVVGVSLEPENDAVCQQPVAIPGVAHIDLLQPAGGNEGGNSVLRFFVGNVRSSHCMQIALHWAAGALVCINAEGTEDDCQVQFASSALRGPDIAPGACAGWDTVQKEAF
jgi:hypothetical protein